VVEILLHLLLLSVGGGNHLCSCVDNLEEKKQPSSFKPSLGPIYNANFFSVKAIFFFFPFVFRACTLSQMETSKATPHYFLHLSYVNNLMPRH
jgi:hypothetical protein